MTVTIKSSGIQLDLKTDATLNIETSSPIFANANSMSLPLSLPMTSNNRRALNFPDRLDMSNPSESTIRELADVIVIVRQGIWQQYATLSILSCSRENIEVTLYFHEASLLSRMDEFTLPQVFAGYYWAAGGVPAVGGNLNSARASLFNALNNDLKTYLGISDVREGTDYRNFRYLDWQQMWQQRATWLKTREFVVAPVYTEDGWLNKIKCADDLSCHELVPTTNYLYITAFLRLDFILHHLFECFGVTLTIDFNSLSEDDKQCFFEEQWHSVFVLNNTMDALYPGALYYSALVPDVSCKDFLLAVEAQFGCTFIHQPDGNYKMIFTKNKLTTPQAQVLKNHSDFGIAFNASPEYSPADGIGKFTSANVQQVNMPSLSPVHSIEQHNLRDSYPNLNVASLEGVCQRTTTSTIDGEDSTKTTACPLVFINFDTAYVPCEDEDAQRDILIFYPCLRNPYFEYSEDGPDGQFDERSAKPLPYVTEDEDSLYYHVNGVYDLLASACDSVTLTTMLETFSVMVFDYTRPYIIQGRLCWPYKLQYELENGNEQRVTMELMAPHKYP